MMKPFRVMSYNIRFDSPGDGPFRWLHRSHMVSSMVLFHKADVVGMQEVVYNQLQDLDTSFKNNYKWVGVGRDDGRLGGEFVPIFYKTSKVDLLDSGYFWLSETPSVPGSKSWGSACPRMATWGLFNLKKPPPDMSEIARIEGVKLIKQRIAIELSKDRRNVGVVFVGDFNATESSAPIQAVTAASESSTGHPTLDFRNAKHVSANPHHGPNGTFTGFNFEIINRTSDTSPYMFVSGGVQVERHGVLADTFGEGYAPSDHRPVVCDIALT